MSSELLELERKRCAAFDAMDLDTLRTIVAEDYIHVHGNGIFDQNRDQYFTTLGTRTPGRYESGRGELIVREYGDAAIMAGPFNAKLWPEDGSEMREVIANAIGVWRRVDGHWRISSFQVTKKA